MKDYEETEWSIDEAEPEDAWGIVDVFSEVYDDYPYIEDVYESVDQDEVYMLAAKNQEDEIIGTASLIPHGDGRYEFGRTAIREDAREMSASDRSPFRDLMDERMIEAEETNARLLLTNAVAEHGKTQHVYSSEGFDPVFFRPFAKRDKSGRNIRDSNIMMVKSLEEQCNKDVYVSNSSHKLVDTVLGSTGDERNVMEGLDYFQDLDIDITEDEKNDLAQITVRPGYGVKDVQEFDQILNRTAEESDAAEVILDANSPIASILGRRMPEDMYSTGFIPGYLEGGNDALVFSYWDDDAESELNTIRPQKIAQFTEGSKDLVESSGAWEDYSMKPHEELSGVFEVYAKKGLKQTIAQKVKS